MAPLRRRESAGGRAGFILRGTNLAHDLLPVPKRGREVPQSLLDRALERTHDIVVLLGLCADYDDAFAGLASDSAILNEYAVAGRYPGDLAFEDIDLMDAQEAVAIVCQIRDLVADKLVSSSHSEG